MPEAMHTEAVSLGGVRVRQGAAIASVAGALPPTTVPTSVIAERLGLDEQWIVSRTGVEERRVVQPGERLSDLAADAGRLALERAGLAAEDLDLVLVASFTQDELLPHASVLVADLIGATRAGAIEIGAACMGFLSGLTLAAAQIESGRARHVLVVGADVVTRYIDFDDRRTAGLMGDGAGAAVISAVDPPGRIGPFVLGADAIGAELVYMTRREQIFTMEGGETYKQAVRRVVEMTLRAIEAAGLELEDIDLFAYHQANARILKAVGDRLALPPERVVNAIALTGNTNGASIPLALAAAERDGRLHDGARVLMGAIGAGFTFGACVVEWGIDER